MAKKINFNPISGKFDYTEDISGLEPALGNPAADGYVLSSTIAGVRSWIAAGAGDMILASIQTITGAKTFGTIGGAVGKLILAGSTSGSSILNAAAVAGTTTITLPASTGTLALTDQTMYIGTTAVAINRASAALTLAGITLTTPDIGTPSAGTLTNCTFPTLNQNTTGTAAGLSATLAIASGGTGATAKEAAFDALSPVTTAGDIIYRTTVNTRLLIGTAGQVLTVNAGATAPEWAAAGGGGQTLYDAIVAPSGGDYTDIQSAIAAGKTRIFVRAGTYTLSADITFAADETVLMGESWDTVIAAGASYKINMSSRSNCLIQNLKVTGTKTDTGSIYQITAGNSNTIRGCFLDCSYGIDIQIGNYHKVINNFVTGTAGLNGISVAHPSAYNNISGNTIYDFGLTGGAIVTIAIYNNSKQTTVLNNIIKNCGNSSSTGCYGISTGQFCLISDNIISNLEASATATIRGIYSGSSNTTICNNKISSLGLTNGENVYGIQSSSYSSVSGNDISSLGNITNSLLVTGIEGGSYSPIVGNLILTLNAKSAGSVVTGIDISEKSWSSVSSNILITLNGAVKNGITYTTGQVNKIFSNSLPDNLTNKLLGTGINNDIFSNGVNPLYEQKALYMKNTSGAGVVLGDVVKLKAVAAGNEFTTTTTLGDDMVLGMVTATIADAAYGYIQTLGKTVALKVNGTTDIAIGDFIGCFTTAGISCKAAAGDMAIAIALEAYATDDSAGVIDALLITPRKI